MRTLKPVRTLKSKRPWKLLTITILMLSLLASCSGQSDNTQNPPKGAEKVNYEENDPEKLEQQKEKERKEREALEMERKSELGEFYVPLPPLGQERNLKTAKAKAIYLTANVAGFDFNIEDVMYYADYIKAISGQSGKPADAGRLGDVNKLEKALGICEATEINSLVIDIKNDDGVVAWDSNIEIVNSIKSNATKPLKNYDKLINYLREKEIYTIASLITS